MTGSRFQLGPIVRGDTHVTLMKVSSFTVLDKRFQSARWKKFYVLRAKIQFSIPSVHNMSFTFPRNGPL